MRDIVVWACLVLGAASILTQLAGYLVMVIRPALGAVKTETALGSVFDIVKGLTDKAPLMVGGIVLIVLAAIFSGLLNASLSLGK